MNRSLIALMIMSVAFTAWGQTVQVTDHEVRVTVRDRNGQFVKNLNADAFAVYDNDVRQKVVDIGEKQQSPIRLAVVIDRSNSVGERFALIQNAAETFVRTMIREQDDQGMVVAFDSRVYVLQDWTADTASLAGSIESLSAAGGTAVFDAVYKTCRDKFNIADTRQKVMVLITDGEDTTSNATFEQSLAMAMQSDVTVYVVGIRAEDSLNTRDLQGRKVLTELAELTGGRVFYPKDSREQLGNLFESLQSEMRNEYSLVYDVEGEPDNSFHKIRVEALDRSLTLHSPTGYYLRKPVTLP
jgi:VWFA-related protein